MPAVSVRDVHKKFGEVTALGGVSFEVAEGSIFGLIGADGAGKTTLMRVLVTLMAPDKGSAYVLNKNIARQHADIRKTIGYMPQRFSLYQDLSVRENLSFFADVFGISAAERGERMKKLLAFSRLDEFINRRAAHLSGGMKQKLALACALIHTPVLLFLDEPTTGVDPVSRKEFWEILFDLKRQGITIVVSTPYMDEANGCDELLFLHKGQVVKQGAPAALLREYPYTLYKVSSSSAGISVPADTPLPAGVALMYPAGGTLHAAVTDADPERLLEAVRAYVPSADRIERSKPSIEDLLFMLLVSQEQEGAQ